MMMTLEAVVGITRKEWSSTPFVWGHADCFMSVFDYVRQFTGIDGGAEWRGTYSDEAGALAVLAAAGGGLAGFSKGMEIVGAVKVDAPELGDVIVARFGEHDVGGLCLGDMLLFRMERGSIHLDRRMVKIVGAWRPS